MSISINIKQHVLTELANSNVALTRAEIYAGIRHLCNARKDCDNAIDNLFRQGLIEKGPSDYENGKTRLTYQLSAKGAKTRTKPDDKPTAGNTDTIETAIDAPAAQIAESVTEAEDEPSETEASGTDSHEISEALSHSENPAIQLDPTDDTDRLLIALATLLKKPVAPTIANKAEKIGVLKLMRDHYHFISTDFETVLGDIISDIEQLEAA